MVSVPGTPGPFPSPRAVATARKLSDTITTADGCATSTHCRADTRLNFPVLHDLDILESSYFDSRRIHRCARKPGDIDIHRRVAHFGADENFETNAGASKDRGRGEICGARGFDIYTCRSNTAVPVLLPSLVHCAFSYFTLSSYTRKHPNNMALDQRGDISIVEIIIYIPILIVGAILVMRHGFSRKAGWVFLVILAILRLVGGITHIISETSDKNSIGLIITWEVCEASGTSPLLIALLGFLSAAAVGVLEGSFLFTRGARLAGLVGTVALILVIYGGVKVGDPSNEGDISQGLKIRRAGACLFIVLYAFLVLFACNVWAQAGRLSAPKRRFLTGITLAMPFVAVRVLYTVLSAFSPANETVLPDGQVVFFQNDDKGLSRFSSATGSWVAFLVMSLLMEYAAVVIFAVTGLGLRAEDEVSESKSWGV